ncbi:hypothetical protein ACWDE9_35610 [Streptomyces olivaceoviridis]|uniref:hypothetical protein n=1 Tax=Streptomyces olivaceoviridis TaxID=1921 RepID=UPI001678BB6B|nr:hypothetical protein [Streptomyces olivaceoviridis]GGY73003.1 hypothetical protein GCM10010300_15460 [Streptomyces olivaceoviridis]
MTGERKSLEARRAEAAESGYRAAGYCGLLHPEGKARCTSPPYHPGRRHVDYYNGRQSLGDVTGTEWVE